MASLEAIHANLLWMAIAWPLLLALPWVRIRDSRLRYLAILPVAALAVWPGDAALALPQFMLSTGLAVESQRRWLLVMSVAVWLAAASIQRSRRKASSPDPGRIFFLLTLAGNLGAVLVTDIAGFFSFSVLMGYSFYGLFVGGADEAAQRAGRVYLVFVIFADQLLFEAMLIAANDTPDLRFDAVRRAMAGGGHTGTYVLFALIGFGIKAGLWPSHWWLPTGYRSTVPGTAVLLTGVPVAMALLGAGRWLPLGQLSDYGLGAALQVLGVSAAAYGAYRLARFASAKSIPAWTTVIGTGLFFALIGRLLVAPVQWEFYGKLIPVYVASLGLFAMAMAVAIDALRGRLRQPPSEPAPATALRLGRRVHALRESSAERFLLSRSRLYATLLRTAERCRRLTEGKLLGSGGWRPALAIFVLMGLLLAWLAM